jgi:hypothetical protein
MKQTAVDFLYGIFYGDKKIYGFDPGSFKQEKVLKKAKAIEKEDLHVEYMKGWRDGYNNQQSVTDDTL